jgi:tungstate transport system ATP-binding protein
MRDSIFNLRQIQKRYTHRFQLYVEKLDIMKGEVHALVGPNGSGKSTLLRILHLLEPPDHGQIFLDQQEIQRPIELNIRREISMVFQRPILLNTSVRNNIAYPLQLRGQVDEKRIEETLSQFDLDRLADADARSLSGGETQRVALARALVTHPKVLLLDEPAANLDPQNVERIEAIIEEIRRSGATTIILVTHEVYQANRLADRTTMLLDGEIVETAYSTEFFRSPGDPRAKAFIRGEMVY